MSNLVFKAEKRSTVGKGSSRRLRHSNHVPAVIYGKGLDAISISLNHDDVNHAQEKDNFYQEILTIVVDGKEEKVKVQAIQRHAFKPKLVHLDFIRV